MMALRIDDDHPTADERSGALKVNAKAQSRAAFLLEGLFRRPSLHLEES